MKNAIPLVSLISFGQLSRIQFPSELCRENGEKVDQVDHRKRKEAKCAALTPIKFPRLVEGFSFKLSESPQSKLRFRFMCLT